LVKPLSLGENSNSFWPNLYLLAKPPSLHG